MFMKAFDLGDPNYEESWADRLVMYHNSAAKRLVDISMFPMILMYTSILKPSTHLVRQYPMQSWIYYSGNSVNQFKVGHPWNDFSDIKPCVSIWKLCKSPGVDRKAAERRSELGDI